MKRTFSIVAVVLAAWAVHLGNAQAQDSQLEPARRAFWASGSGDFIGDMRSSASGPKSLARRTSDYIGDIRPSSLPQGSPRAAALPASFANSRFFSQTTATRWDQACDGCEGGCDSCRVGNWCDDSCSSWWYGVEFMHIYLKGRSIPALVTTSDQIDEGVLGRPTTTTVFGDERIGDDRQAGGRITIGKWLDPQGCVGIGVRMFGMEGDRTNFSSTSAGDPLVARPFFNVDPRVQAEDSFLVAAQGISSGSLNILTSSDMLNGEAYLRYLLLRRHNFRLDFLGGYHFNRLDDGLVIRTTSVSQPPNGPAPIGSTFGVEDVFDVSNEFHGGELGLLGEWQRGCLKVGVLGKVSIGNMNQQLRVSGSTVVNDGAGGVVSYNGGLLALPFDNIGVYETNETGFIPEAGVNLSYALTKRIELTVGYTFMHWNKVALAGDQIDTNINASQLAGGNLVGQPLPAFLGFRQTSYWLQSINIGVTGEF